MIQKVLIYLLLWPISILHKQIEAESMSKFSFKIHLFPKVLAETISMKYKALVVKIILYRNKDICKECAKFLSETLITEIQILNRSRYNSFLHKIESDVYNRHNFGKLFKQHISYYKLLISETSLNTVEVLIVNNQIKLFQELLDKREKQPIEKFYSPLKTVGIQDQEFEKKLELEQTIKDLNFSFKNNLNTDSLLETCENGGLTRKTIWVKKCTDLGNLIYFLLHNKIYTPSNKDEVFMAKQFILIFRANCSYRAVTDHIDEGNDEIQQNFKILFRNFIAEEPVKIHI